MNIERIRLGIKNRNRLIIVPLFLYRTQEGDSNSTYFEEGQLADMN